MSTAGFLPSPTACLSLMWDLGPGAREACSHSSLDAHSEEALHVFTMEVISFSSLLLLLIFFINIFQWRSVEKSLWVGTDFSRVWAPMHSHQFKPVS